MMPHAWRSRRCCCCNVRKGMHALWWRDFTLQKLPHDGLRQQQHPGILEAIRECQAPRSHSSGLSGQRSGSRQPLLRKTRLLTLICAPTNMGYPAEREQLMRTCQQHRPARAELVRGQLSTYNSSLVLCLALNYIARPPCRRGAPDVTKSKYEAWVLRHPVPGAFYRLVMPLYA